MRSTVHARIWELRREISLFALKCRSLQARSPHGLLVSFSRRLSMQVNRRQMIAAAVTAGVRSGFGATPSYKTKPRTGPSMDELARAAAVPVLNREGLDRPVVIDSIE